MRVYRATRHIAATADRIYLALTTRETVQRWLPPDGAHGIIDAFEPRPGGAFRMTLVFETHGAPGTGKSTPTTDVVDGSFLNLVQDRFVRQRFEFQSDDAAFAGAMEMIWTLTPAPDGTDVTVTAENVPAGIGQQDHETAMASSLANLAKCVERSAG